MPQTAPLLDQTDPPSPSETQALAPATDDLSGVGMFERLARDPNTSVEKIERLMALWERGEARKAVAAFNVAMTAAQTEMHAIAPDAYNPQTKSKYASYEALDRVMRPIYTKHGFALSFNTGDAPVAEYVRVLCDVTHLGGHAKPYQADMPADGKGAKGGDVMTKTHAAASAMSYGMRYLLKMIFNVAVGEDDDDGNRAANTAAAPEPPKGFVDWLDDLKAVSLEGTARLQDTWNKSKPQFRAHLTRHTPQIWHQIKTAAEKVPA